MTVTEEFALLLDQLDIGIYDNAGITGDIFLSRLPPQPDAAIAVARYGAGESDSKLPYDTVNLQFRVRGSNTDVRAGEARAQAIYDALQGMSSRTLPGGTWLALCVGVQGGPVDIGPDQHDRSEWTVNMRVELERRTTNRP